MLNEAHGRNYCIFNLTGEHYDHLKFSGRVLDQVRHQFDTSLSFEIESFIFTCSSTFPITIHHV